MSLHIDALAYIPYLDTQKMYLVFVVRRKYRDNVFILQLVCLSQMCTIVGFEFSPFIDLMLLLSPTLLPLKTVEDVLSIKF